MGGAGGDRRELRRPCLAEYGRGSSPAAPRLFVLLPGDVGLVQVSPPGLDGLCSLGIGADYAADAGPPFPRPDRRDQPSDAGDQWITRHLEPRFAAGLETDRPLPEAPDRAPDEIDAAIAARVAGLVEDGDTIQMGVGSLPTAVLDGLSGHRDLGFTPG